MQNLPDTATNCPATNPLIQLQLPSYVADKIWNETDELLKDGESNVCPSPGSTNGLEYLVKSLDDKHKHPYFVECKVSGQIICEKSCALYSSCKVCTHTVAVARHTESISRYVQWHLRQRSCINLSALADVNMPKGAGKKSRSHRKASQKSSTKRIKVMLSQAESDELAPRIKLKPAITHQPSPSPDLPGPLELPEPSELSGTHHRPPPAVYPIRAMTTSPDPLMTYYINQPPRPPPPLVSTGSLMQHISMSHSPSASVVYAPLVTTVPCTPVEEDTFWLQFIKGNISRCNGCGKRDLRGVDGKPKPPPHDLCLQHKEYVIFENTHTGMHQLFSDLRNVYYHASVRCVTQKHGDFNPSRNVKVGGEVKMKLSRVHLAYLLSEFGLAMLNK